MSDNQKVSSDYIFDEVSDEEANNFKIDPFMINFLTNEPFFSYILRNLKRIKTFDIPTAGVTAINGQLTLYWNPKFLASLEPREIMGLLKHECYHLIFKHCTARKQKPFKMWNIAADLAINSLIPEPELPKGGLIPGRALKHIYTIEDPLAKDAWQKLSNLIKGLPKNMTAEYYMDKLKNDEDLQEAISKLPSDGSQSSFTFDDHDGWGQLSEEEKSLVEGQIKDVISNASKEADRNNGWGSVSASVRRQIREMIKTNVDWRKVLQTFIGRSQRANKASTHRKINRKYPYIHPGRKTGHTSNLAVYIDQSGSISDADIAMFTSTLYDLSKKSTFTFYNFDTRVDEKSKKTWKKGKRRINIERTLSGGTCFRAVEDHFRDFKGNYDGYIVLTDGAAAKPPPCVKRRCWVILPSYKLAFDNDKIDTVVTMEN